MLEVPLPVVLGLPEEVTCRFGTTEVRIITQEVQNAVQASLDALAVPGSPSAHIVEAGDDRTVLHLTVGGRRCAAPDVTLIRAYHMAAGTSPSWRTTVEDVREWTMNASPAQLAAFAGSWCDGVIERQPAVVLSEAQADAYGEYLTRHHDVEIPAAFLPTVLRSLLALRIPLGSTTAVAGALSSGLSPEDATEHLIAQLRPDTLDIRADPAVLRHVTTAMDHDERDHVLRLRDSLFTELGVILPDLRFLTDPTLLPQTIRIGVNALASPPMQVPEEGMVAVNASADRLSRLGISGQDTLLPVRAPAAIVPASEQDHLRALGFTTWDAPDWLMLAVAAAVRERAECFVDEKSVQALLDSFQTVFPVARAQAQIPLTDLAPALRSVAWSKVPIRNMRPILEAVVLRNTVSSPGEDLTETIRRAAAPETTESVAAEGASLPVILLPHGLEEQLSRSAGTWNPSLPVNDDLADKLVCALHAELDSWPTASSYPVVLVSAQARAAVARVIGPVFPEIRVLSSSDLLPTISLRPVAQHGGF